MAEITSLDYAVFGVSDLQRWADFAGDVVGFQIGERSGDQLLLRMDEHDYRIVLERGAEDDLRAAGWQFDTEEALEEFVARLKSLRIDVARGSADLKKKRRVEAIYVCDDPNGFQHEFHFGPSIAPDFEPFRSKVVQSSFVTGPLGLGHILPPARDYEQSVKFYKEVLGLRVSGYIRPPTGDITAIFFHTRTGRFHSLATAQLPHGKWLHHFGVELADFNDVGRAYDRALGAGVPILGSIGHHPNAKTTSFYMATPSGFGIELSHGEIVVDDANWQVTTYSQLSDWGHKGLAPARPEDAA